MALHGFLRGYRGYADTQALGNALRALQEEGLDQLPLPGSGDTLARLSQLAQVAGHDLRLCKLFEGHTDALAILADLAWLGLVPDGPVLVQSTRRDQHDAALRVRMTEHAVEIVARFLGRHGDKSGIGERQLKADHWITC